VPAEVSFGFLPGTWKAELMASRSPVFSVSLFFGEMLRIETKASWILPLKYTFSPQLFNH
jgi:hypothetical protein